MKAILKESTIIAGITYEKGECDVPERHIATLRAAGRLIERPKKVKKNKQVILDESKPTQVESKKEDKSSSIRVKNK